MIPENGKPLGTARARKITKKVAAKLAATAGAAYGNRPPYGPGNPPPAKPKKVPTFKGDLRPPSGIVRNSPVNQAKAAAAERAAKSTSTPAPVVQKAAAAAASGGNTQADLISQYNLERAKILQGMAPQIQDIYQQAGANIGGAVDAAGQATHDALYAAGGGKEAAFNDQIDPRIAASYNPDAAPNAAAYLGKVLPQDTLNTQGASYGAAAAFAPGAALQEGQYALVKAIEDAKVKNADAAKVSASVSKMLGYVADAYGNPVLGKNGKPVKLPAQQMTPYQQAQLKLSAGRLDFSIQSANQRINYQQYKDDRNYKLAVDKANATNNRYYDGQVFKSAQAAKLAKQKSETIDWNASTKAGVIVNKDGSIRHDAHGRTLSFTPANAPEKKQPKLTANQKVKLRSDAAADAHDAKNGWTDPSSGQVHPPMGYQEALQGMLGHYPIEYIYQALNRVYPIGTNGRPWLNLNQRNALIRRGIPQSAVEEAMFDKNKSLSLAKMTKAQIKRTYGTARG